MSSATKALTDGGYPYLVAEVGGTDRRLRLCRACTGRAPPIARRSRICVYVDVRARIGAASAALLLDRLIAEARRAASAR